VEDDILMPQPLELVQSSCGVLLVCCQMHTMLHASPSGVVLEVEQVLHVPSQRSHPDMEVRALEVGLGLKALLPYRVLLIPNREKCDRQCCCSGEAVLAQGGEGNVRHHLDAGVGLAADDGPRLRLRGVKEYRHTNLAPIQAMGLGQSAVVDRCIPVVAEMEECII
jgi:hypothetical protein